MNTISPGLYVNEQDFPTFQQSVSTTRVCIVGGATKGPLNKPTLVSSQGSLIEKFGIPSLSDMGLQAAMQYLAEGFQLIFLRVGHSPATASRTIAGLTGGTPAAKATGYIRFTSSYQPIDTETVTINDGVTARIFEFDNNNTVTAGRISVAIGSTSAATMANLLVAVNNSNVATAVDASVSVPQINLTAKTGGTAANVTTTTSAPSGSTLTVSGMAGGAAAIAGSSTNVVTFTAVSPGTWGNTVQVKITTPSTVVNPPANSFDVAVYAPGVPGAAATLMESWSNLSLDPASDRYIESALPNGIANEQGASRFILADALTTGAPTSGTYTLSEGGGTVGTDGISGLVPADYVGTVTGQSATGLKAVRNAESTEYNILAIPGVTHATVITAMIEHAEFRRDHLVLIDTPFGLSADDAVLWVNGQQPSGVPNSPAAALTSSYASVSWPWIQSYDSFNKRDVWVPPSGATAAIMARTDRMAGPWLPSAGANRGAIRGTKDLEFSPDQTTRNTLYENNINPFVKFPDTGIIRYGNKTLQRVNSLTQSEHARRTLIYAQKICAGAVKFLVFDPNDSTTWRKFESLCNTALSSIKAARGLAEFGVVCNQNTNPPDQRARGEMRGALVAQPVEVAERITLSFASTATGTAFGDEVVVAAG